MAETRNLFTETMEVMEPGDSLMIIGGTFPGPNEGAEILLGLKQIIPILHIVTGNSKYSPRPNPVFKEGDEDPQSFQLERNDKRFGQDYGDGPNIIFGRGAGLILGQTVDLLILGPMTPNEFFFVSKP